MGRSREQASFPLTLALSLQERGERPALTPALSLWERGKDAYPPRKLTAVAG